MIRSLIAFLIFGLLFFPYILVAFQVESWSFSLSVSQKLPMILLQAIGSAFLSLVMGFWAALGLRWLVFKKYFSMASYLQVALIIPSGLPSLLYLLFFLGYFAGQRGLSAVVFLHALILSGLCAVAYLRFLKKYVDGLQPIALLSGASQVQFFQALWKLLFAESCRLFLSIFALSLTSFSIPLVAGGSQPLSMEVWIYENMQKGFLGFEVLALSLLQWAMVGICVVLVLRGRSTGEEWVPSSPRTLCLRSGVLVGILPVAIGLWTLISQLPATLLLFPSFLSQASFRSGIIQSFLVSLGTGLLLFLAFNFFLWLQVRWKLNSGWVFTYLPPSSPLLALVFLLYMNSSIITLVCALSAVFFFPIYRLFLGSLMDSLKSTESVSQIYGASRGLVWRWLVFPRIVTAVGTSSGVAAFWAWGEFAVSHIILEQADTIALMAYQNLGAYRFESALVLLTVMVLMGVVSFLIFWSLGYVLCEKPLVYEREIYFEGE